MIRLGHGAEVCQSTGIIREDKLLATIKRDYAAIFDNAEGLIEAASARAVEIASAKQEDTGRIRREIAEVDRKISSMVGLLSDPDIESLAKKATSCQRRRENRANQPV